MLKLYNCVSENLALIDCHELRGLSRAHRLTVRKHFPHLPFFLDRTCHFDRAELALLF